MERRRREEGHIPPAVWFSKEFRARRATNGEVHLGVTLPHWLAVLVLAGTSLLCWRIGRLGERLRYDVAMTEAERSKTVPILPARTELTTLLRNPRAFASSYAAPLVVLFVGAAADLLTTYHNMRLYGPGVEAHPAQRWVAQLVGVRAGVPIAKMIQLGFVLVVAAWWRGWTRWVLYLCGLLYAAAAVSNFFLLL